MTSVDQSDTQRRRTRRGALLLLGVGLLFLVAVLATPAALTDITNLDTLAQRYAAVAAHERDYRLVNLVLGIATVLTVVAASQLTGGQVPRRPFEVAALACGGVAGATWVAEAALRATVVVDRARDLAADRAASGTALTDQLIAGDGVLIIAALLAMAVIAALALAWHRRGHIGRPTAGALILGSLAGAALVRADPFAYVFVPFFPFLIGFVPAGIVILLRTRRKPSVRAGVTATG